jgi:hypothetical protein
MPPSRAFPNTAYKAGAFESASDAHADVVPQAPRPDVPTQGEMDAEGHAEVGWPGVPRHGRQRRDRQGDLQAAAIAWSAYYLLTLDGYAVLTCEHAMTGAAVWLAARNESRANRAIDDLERETGRRAQFLQLDLADLGSVKKAAQELKSCATSC